MTKKAKREYVEAMRPRYHAAEDRAEQSSILDEIAKVTKFNRKYLIRVLQKKADPVYPKALYGDTATKKPRGRPPKYESASMTTFLCRLWHSTNQACSKRLKGLLPLWLPKYEEATGIALSLADQVLLTSMTHTTMDRLLAEERSKYRIGKGRMTTKPGTLMKNTIPIKTDQWQEERPGFLEGDTVAHCGTSTRGMFVYSLNAVDIASAWTETRAMWGKGEMGAVGAFEEIEAALPFPLCGFDSDNGSEFINHHFCTYLRKKRKRMVEQTRSRPYKKNDNAHIEQKNWTHIRQIFGYARFDNPQVVPLMNELYAKELSLYMNFFLPSVKLKEKERVGSQIKKRHDKPMTPVERLLAMHSIPEEVKRRLRTQRAALNPFLLYQTIQKKTKAILAMATLTPSTAPNITTLLHVPTNNQRRKPQKASLPKRAPAHPGIPDHLPTLKHKKQLNVKNR